MTFKKVLHIVFLTFICVITTEWINIEEIFGGTSVEINLEENLELETFKKVKEGANDDFGSFFFTISETFHLTEIINHQFLFENALSDHIIDRVLKVPLFLLHQRLQLDCQEK